MTVFYDDLVSAGVNYQPPIFGQNVPPGFADGLVFSAPIMAGATAMTLSGPSSGAVGAPSSAFTVGANGPITGTIIFTPTSSAGTGSFSPTTVSLTSGNPTRTFTYTATSAGSRNINGTNNRGLTAPSNIAYNATANTITLSGPSGGPRAQLSSPFTVGCGTPAVSSTIVTPTDSSGQGTFTPTSVTIPQGSTTASRTFRYRPLTSGARNINVTNNRGMNPPSDIVYTATPVPEAILTGTTAGGISPDAVVVGGETSIVTLIDETYVASGGTFDGERQAFINGFTSDGSELHGWNNEVRDTQAVTGVTRQSDTQATATWDAAPLYEISVTETITPIIPGSILTGGNPLVAHPDFSVIGTPVTSEEIQAVLDTRGTGRIILILRQVFVGQTVANYYVVGMSPFPGRAMWVTTNSSQSAAAQAADIVAALLEFS